VTGRRPGLDRVHHVRGVEPEPRDGRPVDVDPQHREARHLLDLHVGGALDLGEHAGERVAGGLELVEVVAVQDQRHVRADPLDQLVRAQLDRLAEREVHAGHVLPEAPSIAATSDSLSWASTQSSGGVSMTIRSLKSTPIGSVAISAPRSC
jgi:hypothetical protein